MNATTVESLRAEVGQLAGRARPSTLSDAERVERAKRVMLDRVGAQHATYLETCIHCGMCAEACHFYQGTHEAKYTPIHKVEPLKRVYRREKGPLRWLYRLATRDINAAELERYQELVFDACTECGRCDLMCPMGLQISPMIGIMREALTAAELAPAEFRAVAAERSTGTVLGVGRADLVALAGRLAAAGTPVRVDAERADIAYLATALDVRVFNDSVKYAARIFDRLGVSWTLLGASIALLGSGESAAELDIAPLVAEAEKRGVKTVILPECGHSYPLLRFGGANALGRALPFEVLTIAEFIGREVAAGRLKVKPIDGRPKVTYHDPCKIGRHGGVFAEPRAALAALGVELIEMESHERTNYCCGGGSEQFLIERAKPLRRRAFEIKMREVDDTGAAAVVTACNSCRYNYSTGAADANWKTPVQSLVELIGSHLAD